MKKYFTIILVLALIIICFAGCSAENDEAYYDNEDNSVDSEEGNSIEPEVILNQSNRKIKYTVNLQMTTDDFDKTLQDINNAVTEDEEQNNWISQSNISQNKTYKRANLTLRIKTDELNAFLAKLPDMGNISSQNQTSEDITHNYASAEARITALEEEKAYYKSLIEDEEIVLEPQVMAQYIKFVSDINSQLELLQNELSKYDSDIDYSTVIIELKYYSDKPTEKSFGTKIKGAFSGSIDFAWYAFQKVFVALIYLLPFVIVGGLITFGAVKLSKVAKKRRKGKKELEKIKKDMSKK